MILIKSSLFFLFMLVFTPAYAVMCIVIFPLISAEKRYELTKGWNITMTYLAKKICGIEYEILGMDNLKAMLDKPVIILSKHQSAWETISFIALIPKQLCFVFKRELLWIPFFGWALALLRMIHINRSNKAAASQSIAGQGKKYLGQGLWIIIFPEGTRTKVGANTLYRKGGARLASATKAWVIPIAHNAGHVWPRNSFLKYPGKVTISIGPAISSENKSAEQLHQETEKWIEAEMRVIDAPAYAPK
ncbi:MAG: lysophospholipid acyltransferase family protein [Polynucleobacter victoriensis]|jgi:1-acyl-sn-glycerol-3-phosphate acyltransferase